METITSKETLKNCMLKFVDEIAFIHNRIDRMSAGSGIDANQVNAIAKENAELQKALKDITQKNLALAKDLDNIRSANTQLLESASTLDNENANFIKVNKELTAHIKELKEKNKAFELAHEELKKSSTELKRENIELKEEPTVIKKEYAQSQVLTRRQAEEQLHESFTEEQLQESCINEEPTSEDLDSLLETEPQQDYNSLCREQIKEIIKTNDMEKIKSMRKLFKFFKAKNIDSLETSQLETFHGKLVKING